MTPRRFFRDRTATAECVNAQAPQTKITPVPGPWYRQDRCVRLFHALAPNPLCFLALAHELLGLRRPMPTALDMVA